MFATSTPLRKRPSKALKYRLLNTLHQLPHSVPLPDKISDSIASKETLVFLDDAVLDLVFALLHKVAQVVGDGLEAVPLSVHSLALSGAQQA